MHNANFLRTLAVVAHLFMNFFNTFAVLPHRRAYALAWPMILANISTPLMGLVDTAMLGHLSSAVFIGAVAVGSHVVAFMLWMFGFLRMGTTSLTGRAFGAGNHSAIVSQLLQNALLAGLIGLAMILLQFVTVPLAMNLMAPDPETRELAARYCHIRIYSAPAVLITYVILGWFIGLGQTRIPLLVTVAANLFNIVLDYCFIVVLSWASDGAAIATLIAENCALVLALAAVLKQLRKTKWKTRGFRDYFSGIDWRKLLSINSDLFIRTIILLFVINFVVAQSAQFGEIVLAANTIIMQLVFFSALTLDGYAHAAESMVAKALGAKDLREFYASCGATAGASALIALVLALAFWLRSDAMILLMTDLREVVDTTKNFSEWLVILPLVSVGCYWLDGIFIGASQTRIMRNTMLIGVVCVFMPLWWILQSYHNQGLWMAFTIFNSFRGISLAIAYIQLSLLKAWVPPEIEHKDVVA